MSGRGGVTPDTRSMRRFSTSSPWRGWNPISSREDGVPCSRDMVYLNGRPDPFGAKGVSGSDVILGRGNWPPQGQVGTHRLDRPDGNVSCPSCIPKRPAANTIEGGRREKRLKRVDFTRAENSLEGTATEVDKNAVVLGNLSQSLCERLGLYRQRVLPLSWEAASA